MAEVHIFGQIVSGKDFPKQSIFCRWSLQCGNNWKIISGKNEGQTQVVCSEFEDICNWSFPIDIHLVSTGVPGWPKIYIQVYHLDWFGRTHLYGYGFVSLPTSPGSHTLNCYTWRPFGTVRERFVQFFLGGGPRIKYPDLVFNSKDRYKLNTEAMGVVTFDESTCDINCCCDKDCTQQNKLVFAYCKTERNRVYDTRYCQYSMLGYKNHTPFEWKINQNSLLCIMKNNLPPEYSFHGEVHSYFGIIHFVTPPIF
ncbi:Ciliary basal body-associated, B9 protein [Popillia japonica]|uniref:B9 domain-containing protein 2 n=1 Tax=Popillia japonica TaxID=7064 RepID=A0AAW1NB82_POPJA